jgi:phosphoglycerate dehydrogenase-like enzyme
MGGAAALAWAAKMPNLKVLQMPNAGYDDALAYVRPGLTLCNAAGVHDASTAELAVALSLASRRGIPDFVRDQDNENWNHGRRTSLSDSKIGVVGFGSIGKQVAKHLSGFDVEVIGFSRSGKDGAKLISELDNYLPTLDVVILILPLNAESKHLFNKERLSKMKDGALLVNVARGPIVDTDALVAELNSGRIFAALDVTDPEPLPVGHPLWKAKNLLLVPHVGGNSTAFEPRCRKLVESQLELLAAGKELKNIVAQG